MDLLAIFEDERVGNFYPISETRHLSELLVGGRTLIERAKQLFPDHQILQVGRKRIEEHLSISREFLTSNADSVLFLNARLLPSEALVAQLPAENNWRVGENQTLVASLDRELLNSTVMEGEHLEFSADHSLPTLKMHGLKVYEYLWDLLDDNGPRIAEDFFFYADQPGLEVPSNVSVVNQDQVFVDESASLGAGVVLDANGGPIVIESGVTIMPGAVLLGPCFIGRNSTIKVGAKIYGDTTIGEWSKVGGEVENSIVLGYSNKQHDGFLGHSYLGSWVNLGADTNTSDLKNNYGTISVDVPHQGVVDSGRMMLGTLMGDHSKTSINTMLNTGTMVGVFANIFGSGFPPKSVPSFSWGGADGMVPYRLEAAFEVAERVMARRNIPFTTEDRRLLQEIWEATR